MDEPEAPPIDIKNEVDNDPCPPWEFLYTNLLVRGDGVPKAPEKSTLKGCSCIGGCPSDSDMCECAAKNMQLRSEVRTTTGFLYDSEGRLREFDHPIFECNDACACAEYCNNRVTQKGRRCALEIRKTEKRGWGVFAAEDIPSGTYLGVYSGELLTDEEAEVRGKTYNDYNRNYLFDVDFRYIKDYLATQRRKLKQRYTVDAMHVGCFTRFFNHSCDPNSMIVPCVFGDAYPEIPYLAFFTLDPITKGDEITFSYKGDTITNAQERQAKRARYKAKKLLGKKKTAKPGAFGKIDVPCECGSVLCEGSMWNLGSSDDEESGEEGEDSDRSM
ncbi:hypothetical protein M408DRAFT_68124 [Serendipita vermifera MAFF 305830]|uniref:SET domain-containing protein n=1 Tax=Serendipita vermifera MAFF 305830 TaxID=933852 RepID=A0A0C3BAU8_SERVB|nr:hypothetical protein M408DRAFT_68124 [Serendipita vermifera MAFF 305830]